MSLFVAETTGNEVIFTTTCLEKQYNAIDGDLLLVQTSKLGGQPIPVISSAECINYIDGTLDIVRGCLIIGSFAYPKAAPILLPLAGVGAVIQSLLQLIPTDKPNEVLEMLKELEKTLFEVEQKMNETFAEFNSFYTEHEFNVEIIYRSSLLMKLMRNCMMHHNAENVENFRIAYERKSPLSLAYIMMSLLEHSSTNPLIMAMNSEKVKRISTFEKWKTIIEGLLGELFIIESFASGLFKNKNTFDSEILLHRSKEVTSSIHQWKEELKKGEAHYFNEMRDYLGPWLDKNAKLSNRDKADAIKKKLETYLTNDAFYIGVFNHYYGDTHFWKDFDTHSVGPDDQFIKCFGPGGGNTFVYRSKKANFASLEELEEFRRSAEAFRDYSLRGKMPGALIEKPIRNAGFTVLFGFLLEEIRWANFDRREKGPGWFTETFDFGGPAERRIFAGFV